MYSDQSRVLHLGNVANTGENLVRSAQAAGKRWALRNLPAAPSLASPLAWARRGADALAYLNYPKADLVHIHYGPNGYYGRLKAAPFVLHLHGTDLRQDLNRRLVGGLERDALRRADAVIVATPDLLPLAQQIRSDAVWVPNPAPLDAFRFATSGAKPEVRSRSVFFSARWDDTKGGLKLVALAQDLIAQGIEVVGVDWGQYANEARLAGVSLLPKMSPSEFRSQMAHSSVIVGQFTFGFLTISDLEAMAMGVPLVTWVDPALETAVPVSGVPDPSVPTSGVPVSSVPVEGAASAVTYLLLNPAVARAQAGAAQTWVARNRNPFNTIAQLEQIYGALLG